MIQGCCDPLVTKVGKKLDQLNRCHSFDAKHYHIKIEYGKMIFVRYEWTAI